MKWKKTMRSNLWCRKQILEMKPYEFAQRKDRDAVRLNANENPFNTAYNRYPDASQIELRNRIAKITEVTCSEILLGNGSDELIDLILKVFCTPQEDACVVCPPTYGMYAVSAKVLGVNVLEVPLSKRFEVDLEQIRLLPKSCKVLFLCSPNNPTGNEVQDDALEILLKTFDGVVVLDAAYGEFGTSSQWKSKVNDYDNLIVLSTFSKALGMAGIRLGIAHSNPSIINLLNKVKPPYNINSFTLEVAMDKLNNYSEVELEIHQLKKLQKVLAKDMAALPCVEQVYPSQANFLLVKFKNASAVFEYLDEYNVMVRDRTLEVNCSECLRITVGTTSENQKLIDLLKDF